MTMIMMLILLLIMMLTMAMTILMVLVMVMGDNDSGLVQIHSFLSSVIVGFPHG